MTQLLGGTVLEDSIFKQLFLQCLPTNVQLILAPTSDSISINQLAVKADKILEVNPSPTPYVTAVSATSKSDLLAKIDVLTKEVVALTAEAAEQDHGRIQYRSPSRNLSQRNRHRSKSVNPDVEHAGVNAGTTGVMAAVHVDVFLRARLL